MAASRCRKPDTADYCIYALAELGDRIVTRMQHQIVEMPNSNDKINAQVLSIVGAIALRTAKLLINKPLCRKIDLSDRDPLSFESNESMILVHTRL